MDWQWIIVAGCVAVAAAYVVQSARRLWRRECGSCGCSRPARHSENERRQTLPTVPAQSGEQFH